MLSLAFSSVSTQTFLFLRRFASKAVLMLFVLSLLLSASFFLHALFLSQLLSLLTLLLLKKLSSHRFFFLLLLANNCQSSGLLLFSPIVGTLRHCICLFFVFQIDLRNVLVLATTLTASNLAPFAVSIVIETCKDIARLALEGLDELTLPLIRSAASIREFALLLGLCVDIVIVKIVGVLLGELVLTVVLLCLSRRERYCDDFSRVIFLRPSSW